MASPCQASAISVLPFGSTAPMQRSTLSLSTSRVSTPPVPAASPASAPPGSLTPRGTQPRRVRHGRWWLAHHRSGRLGWNPGRRQGGGAERASHRPKRSWQFAGRPPLVPECRPSARGTPGSSCFRPRAPYQGGRCGPLPMAFVRRDAPLEELDEMLTGRGQIPRGHWHTGRR